MLGRRPKSATPSLRALRLVVLSVSMRAACVRAFVFLHASVRACAYALARKQSFFILCVCVLSSSLDELTVFSPPIGQISPTATLKQYWKG